MAMHMFGGDYDLEEVEDPDDVSIMRGVEDRDRPIDVVDCYTGEMPDNDALMDELAHELSASELEALARRIRQDRFFADLAASYDEGDTTALEIVRQAGLSVRGDKEALTKEPPKVRRRKPGQSRKLHRGRKRLHRGCTKRRRTE
jgi:hypothetical protein